MRFLSFPSRGTMTHLPEDVAQALLVEGFLLEGERPSREWRHPDFPNSFLDDDTLLDLLALPVEDIPLMLVEASVAGMRIVGRDGTPWPGRPCPWGASWKVLSLRLEEKL